MPQYILHMLVNFPHMLFLLLFIYFYTVLLIEVFPLLLKSFNVVLIVLN